MVHDERADYREEAVGYATAELDRRGVTRPPLDDPSDDAASEDTTSEDDATFEEAAPLEEMSPGAVSPRRKGVAGWLLLLCVSLTIINPLLSLADALATLQFWSAHTEESHALSRMLVAGVLMESALACFSLYAGFGLWGVSRGAVKMAKAYLLAHLAYAVVTFLLPLTAGLSTPDSLIMLRLGERWLLRSLIYVIICYAYLTKSERVEATYAEDAPPDTCDEHDEPNPAV